MRIAQLTLNVYDNFGNVLQKFALHCMLKKFADFVEVLWHHYTRPFIPAELEWNSFFTGSLRDVAFKSVRQNKIKEFNDVNIRTRFNLPYLEETADEYDFFVVGSDQVWNPKFKLPGRFLEFVPREKRIAYAASITLAELPEDVQENYRERISEIPYVSVREREGCDLIEKLTGKRPLQVLDPVFLLNSNEWRKIAKRPFWLNQKKYERGYVLSYFLDGEMPTKIKVLAKELGLPVINLLDMKNFYHYITGIEEFLYLIDHATLFCTSSFHGTAFALIFKCPFIVYRSKHLMANRFSRIASLLDLFNLNERTTNLKLEIDLADPLKIDFTRRDEVLPIERAKAFTFLAEALGVNPLEKLLGGDA